MSEVEYHVASYVVLTRPENEALITDQINQLPGLEVHASEQGKLVVTAEANNTRKLAEMAGILELMDLVLQVAPVYHEFTTEQDTVQTTNSDAEESIRSQIK